MALSASWGSQAFVSPTITRHSLPPFVVKKMAQDKGNDNEIPKSKKATKMDPAVRSRLLAESIAPWRTLRLFLYGSLGSGAAVGGFITLAGALAAMSGARSDLDLTTGTEYTNLAIDFGAVAAFALAAKFDLEKQSELDEKVETKLELKREQSKVAKAMRLREQALANLMLEIRISADGKTQAAKVQDVQAGAKQHMIIVAGPRMACTKALIGANILKMDFAMNNVLVIPYDTGKSNADVSPSGGFAERPAYENQAYVAQTMGDGWKEYIDAEMNDAVLQSGKKCIQEGIAIVIASNGKVIRRGVGIVPWRQMVDQLAEEVSPGSNPQPVDYLFS